MKSIFDEKTELDRAIAARDDWVARCQGAEREVATLQRICDKLIDKLGGQLPYCTKHQLFHGQKYKSCRPIVEENKE